MKQNHGGNVYAFSTAYGVAPIDFSANINPLGMPEAAAMAARAAVCTATQYPDPDCTALRAALAARLGAQPEHILCGNGAGDLICRFVQAVRPDTTLVCAPTFGEYERAALAAGSKIRRHVLCEADGLRLTDAILPALEGIQALILCNPNNPTGLTIPQPLLTAILDRCAKLGIHVLLDECFIDFLDDPAQHTRAGEISRYPRLVVLGAMTKFYGMPGLRLGYALCADAALLARMDAAGAPWSVSTVAQAAGLAALGDTGFAAESRALVQEERAFMKQMLRQLSLQPMGEANFLLFKAPEGLYERLLAEGVMVRDCGGFAGLGAGWIRVAVRTRRENMQLISRLSRCLHG